MPVLACLLALAGCEAAQAQALAGSRPQAKFHLIAGGHNDWASQPAVRIRNP